MQMAIPAPQGRMVPKQKLRVHRLPASRLDYPATVARVVRQLHTEFIKDTNVKGLQIDLQALSCF